jgi:hypothetical protein
MTTLNLYDPSECLDELFDADLCINNPISKLFRESVKLFELI